MFEISMVKSNTVNNLKMNFYLFSGLEFFAIETVEQQSQEEIENHEVTDDKCRQENGKARFGNPLK
jgi:hypothetical protein